MPSIIIFGLYTPSFFLKELYNSIQYFSYKGLHISDINLIFLINFNMQV